MPHDLSWSAGIQWFIGTHPPIRCMGPRSCFSALFLTLFWDPILGDFGVQNWSKIDQKSMKIDQKWTSIVHVFLTQIFYRFFIDFLSIFMVFATLETLKFANTPWFWAYFSYFTVLLFDVFLARFCLPKSSILNPKTWPKSIKNH